MFKRRRGGPNKIPKFSCPERPVPENIPNITSFVEKERGAAETERAAEGLEAAAATAHKFLSQVSLDFYRNNLKTSHFEPNPSRIFPTGEENEDVVGGIVPGDGRGHGAGGQDPGRNREEIQVRAHITS